MQINRVPLHLGAYFFLRHNDIFSILSLSIYNILIVERLCGLV